MTDKEIQEAASGFLDKAFNLGEPAAPSLSMSAGCSSSTILRSQMERRHSSGSLTRCGANSPGYIWR